MFGAPWYLVSQHGIENGIHLAHAGSKCDFFVFPCGNQPLIGLPNDGIVLNGGQHGHKEDGADTGAATTDTPLASEGPAVPVEWGDTYQRSDLLVGQVAELWQIGQ